MKLSTKKAAAFAGSCVLSAAGWTLFWPKTAGLSPIATSPPVASAIEAPGWPGEKIRDLIDAVAKASDDATRLEACRRLSEIPLADIPSALEMAPLIQDHFLTLTAKVLLIRWADHDGETAAKWAWQRFRKAPVKIGNGYLHDGVWDEAFRQIARAWAYRNPKQFANWLLDRIPADSAARIARPTEQQMLASEQPILSTEWKDLSVMCLIRTTPKLAFEVLQKWHTYGSNDGEYAKALETVEQVKEALLAFDHLQDLRPDITRDGDLFAEMLLDRWYTLNPEDFARSPYHSLVETADWNDRAKSWVDLPPEERRQEADRLAAEKPIISRGNQLASIVGQWARKDPEACREWMETLPEKDSDDVVKSYAAGLAAIDPVQAFEWMKKFPAIKRQKAIAAACNALSFADPGQQQDFTGWSEDEIEAWKDLTALLEVTGKRR